MPATCNNCCMALGANTKLAVSFDAQPADTAGVPQPRTFDATDFRFDFLQAAIVKQRRRVGNRTIKSTLDDFSERSSEGASLIAGRLSFQASPFLLHHFMRATLGKPNLDRDGSALSPPAGTTLYHPNCLENFDLLLRFDAEQAVIQFLQLYVNKMVIRAASEPGANEPEIVQVFMDCFGRSVDTQAAWPSPEPAFGTDEEDLPYVVQESTLTLGGTTVTPDSWTLEIDRGLQVKWRGRLTPTCIFPTKNDVRLRAEIPLCDTIFDVLHETAGSANHVAGILNLAKANTSTKFDFIKMDNVGPDPVVNGKEEVMHQLDLIALAEESSGTPAIVVTSDITV